MGQASAEHDSRLFDLPASPGIPIGKRLTMLDSGGKRAIFLRSTAIHIFDGDDKAAEAACIAMLASAKLATHVEIAEAFGCHRNRVGRIEKRLEQGGISAVVPSKRGPKGPHKITPEVLEIVDEDRAIGGSALVRRIDERTGIKLSVAHVHRLIHRPQGEQQQGSLEAHNDRVGEDTGDHAHGHHEEDGKPDPVHTIASEAAFDPPAVVPRSVRGRYMGCALYYPALAALGLAEGARKVFSLPRSDRFGVRAVMLSLFFLTLLRKPTVESAKHLRRREFGALIGTGRAPATKTLRRKLLELVAQKTTSAFAEALSRRWVDDGMIATAYLYVDGHMKAYSGTRKIKEFWNSQRRMPLPGVMTYFVGDQRGRPLLFVQDDASTLAKAMPALVTAIRKVVGEEPFTVIFDRGGYDSKLYEWLVSEGIDFITYQRGNPELDKTSFARHEARFEGRRVRLRLAEDTVFIKGSGPWRRIVIRTKDGHQTPILTSLRNIGPARIACLMLCRWRQENFFKYMGSHHGLDQLVSYGADAAPGHLMIPNPARKQADAVIAKLRTQAREHRAALGQAVLDEPRDGNRSTHGLKIAQKGAVRKLRDIERNIDDLVAARKQLPKHVPLSSSGKTREILRLEHKALVDRVKITAYNAEEWLLERLAPHYRNANDIRDLLRSFAELSGEIRSTPQGVDVELDAPDTPTHRRALRGLCDDLNAFGATFAGTDLPVTYQVAMHHSEVAA
ncbi:MAG: putative transposase [Gammaproteobacteria bacterium]